MPNISIPQARRIVVDTSGAQIIQEESPSTRDSRGIYLPHYIEPVSHIAIDIGGSLAKVVYFTRSSKPIPATPPASHHASPFLAPIHPISPPPHSIPPIAGPSTSPNGHDPPRLPPVNGALTPQVLVADYLSASPFASRASLSNHPKFRRSSLPPPLPGGLLNFVKFETSNIDDLIAFLQDLISTSARTNRVSLDRMKSTVKVMATGGGAHLFYNRLSTELGVEVLREEEMECLILGLGFVTRVPEEVFYFSEELVYKVSHPPDPSPVRAKPVVEEPIPSSPIELERPSPNPPQYQVTFAPTPAEDEENPHFPCLVVNIGSGVSIVKVDEDGRFERVSGTSLGGGTLWGLLSLLTDARNFDGDNSAVDMLVGDIYGSDYSKIGLKSSTIASTFGKVFKGGEDVEERRKNFRQEDIARSLLYAISNNIGHVAYMNAAKYGLNRVFFGGFFIRGHAATISTLSYAIRFWSKGTMRACFLRHEGFLGSIGAWIKNVQQNELAVEMAEGKEMKLKLPE